MIKNLSIKNFALIENLQLEFQTGLTSITGETGAGKSILLGAIGLILGNRADTSSISEGADKCIIEAEFDLTNHNLSALFDSLDVDYENPCIVRRELTAQGKSRAFINDTPVGLADLKMIGSNLVEIQTQNTTTLVSHKSEQLKLLDDYHFGNNLYSEYSALWKSYLNKSKQLEQTRVQLNDLKAQNDFKSFLFNEIETFNLNIDSDSKLDEELQLLSEVAEIKTALAGLEDLLSESEYSVQNNLISGAGLLKPFSNNSDLNSLWQRLKSLQEEVLDLSRESERFKERLSEDPERLALLNDRSAELDRLLKKHQCQSVFELAQKFQVLGQELESTETLEQLEIELAKDVSKLHVELLNLARKLHDLRLAAAKNLTDRAKAILEQLAMPHAQIQFEIEFQEKLLNDKGANQVSLLFNANPGGKLQPVELVASGGELSRLNFAFRSLISGSKYLPTLIYDEADTGISGEIAGKMGLLFRQLGQRHQVICISHLPQVAASGDHQFEVYKQIEGLKTQTSIRVLNENERVNSIAKMLSSAELTDASINNARELLKIQSTF
jgi:DNA repair protein RecN (Recombination protein N)